MDSIEIVTDDGVRLPASLFECERPQAIAVVSPATATPRGFYHAFCSYLTQHGATALTYDYRGTFEPAQTLRRSSARMRDWGERDFAAVLRFAARRYPGIPIVTVGHSVGGHVLLMTPENVHVQRAFNVASQSGHWEFYRGFEKYKVFAFMTFIMPLLTRIYGYFPGKRFVFGTNLAPGVLYEWARWCRTKGYFQDDPSMAHVIAHAKTLTADVTMAGIADDPWATPKAIGAIATAFVASRVARIEIDPAQYGTGAVGHMGFFRRANADALWPIAVKALALDQHVAV
jgi:predicted alpha/beta hydrolase